MAGSVRLVPKPIHSDETLLFVDYNQIGFLGR